MIAYDSPAPTVMSPNCTHCDGAAKRFGKDRKGNQRFRCLTCRKTFSERPERLLGDMRLPDDKALLCLSLLCEGSSIRAIERVTEVGKRTILNLLVQVGEGCERMLAETIKGVPVKDVQADELWTFIKCKQGTRERRKIADPDAGDAYCYFGIERNTKLVLAWHLGRRNRWDAHDFVEKLDRATAGSFQLSTDGFNGYPNAVEFNLGARADYAQVVKDFGNESGEEARRYGPPRLIGQEKIVISGTPEEDRICTSLALYFAYYNFCRMHKSIRMTPAMAAGLTKKPWSMLDLVRAAMRGGS